MSDVCYVTVWCKDALADKDIGTEFIIRDDAKAWPELRMWARRFNRSFDLYRFVDGGLKKCTFNDILNKTLREVSRGFPVTLVWGEDGKALINKRKR